MSEREALRHQYLHRVCSALATYVDAGEPLRIHSSVCHDRLEITFSLEDIDEFHALLERADEERSARDTSG